MEIVYSHMPYLMPMRIALLCLLFPLLAQAQPDRCAAALALKLNAQPLLQKNDSATLTATEVPHLFPGTCIQTFENDLWYAVTTEPGLAYYEVSIQPTACNTPAGLQALVMQADGCDSTRYRYVSCANPKQVQTLQMAWQESQPGKRYLIYVDGYDGTACEFLIAVTAYASPPVRAALIRPGDSDYYFGPHSSLTAFDLTVRNNEVEIRWQDEPDMQVSHYLVERVYDQFGYKSASVLAEVYPGSQVAFGGVSGYRFTDRGPFRPGAEVCLRVVAVGPAGERVYFQTECATVQPVTSFSVSAPLPDPEKARGFLVQYNLYEKQALAFELLDAGGAVLKSFTLSKKAEKSGFITLDMTGYASGVYRFVCKGKDGAFSYDFEI